MARGRVSNAERTYIIIDTDNFEVWDVVGKDNLRSKLEDLATDGGSGPDEAEYRFQVYETRSNKPVPFAAETGAVRIILA